MRVTSSVNLVPACLGSPVRERSVVFVVIVAVVVADVAQSDELMSLVIVLCVV